MADSLFSVPAEYDSAQRAPALLAEIIEIVRYRDLIAQLVARNIKVRYKRSVLGLAWTMLNPLLMMAILTVVFANVFRIAMEHYAVYVLAALVLWNFFAQTTLTAATDLVWGGSLLQRIYVPRSVFAFAAVGTGLVNLLFALAPLGLITLVSGLSFQPALIVLPLAIFLVTLFALGVGLILSVLAVSFTDVVDIYQVLLSAWFYLTPIIYPLDVLPASYQGLFRFNPMYYFVELFRAPIYAGVFPRVEIVVVASGLALATFAVGGWFFARNADGLAYRV